jgi:2-amino-4-hydroxy-6-hydroxymethyldihydropteridine diphosphokinase
MPVNLVYLLLGTNIGHKEQHLETAIGFIQHDIGNIQTLSSIYQTAAWGNENQDDFLNQVLICETSLEANEVLEKVLEIEKKMGRQRLVKNEPRIIDIDILFFNKEVIAQEFLVVPHPLIHARRFVLAPLDEISPDFIHPVSGNAISQMLEECEDPLPVYKK